MGLIFNISILLLDGLQYKRVMCGQEGELTVPVRLAAGALAGMTASAATHP